MMFDIVWGKNVEGHSSGRAAQITFKGEHFCNLNTWAFSSCACFSIQGFSGWNKFDHSHVDEFFGFLNSEKCEDTWLPNEIYFLLTETQLQCTFAKALVSHPHVRLRDKFTNKSHGDKMMHLYRYSSADDFTRIVTKKSV